MLGSMDSTYDDDDDDVYQPLKDENDSFLKEVPEKDEENKGLSRKLSKMTGTEKDQSTTQARPH